MQTFKLRLFHGIFFVLLSISTHFSFGSDLAQLAAQPKDADKTEEQKKEEIRLKNVKTVVPVYQTLHKMSDQALLARYFCFHLIKSLPALANRVPGSFIRFITPVIVNATTGYAGAQIAQHFVPDLPPVKFSPNDDAQKKAREIRHEVLRDELKRNVLDFALTQVFRNVMLKTTGVQNTQYTVMGNAQVGFAQNMTMTSAPNNVVKDIVENAAIGAVRGAFWTGLKTALWQSYDR